MTVTFAQGLGLTRQIKRFSGLRTGQESKSPLVELVHRSELTIFFQVPFHPIKALHQTQSILNPARHLRRDPEILDLKPFFAWVSRDHKRMRFVSKVRAPETVHVDAISTSVRSGHVVGYPTIPSFEFFRHD